MDDRTLLRHLLAVIAYRGTKPLRDAPAPFPKHDTGSRHTPLVVLSHVSDLVVWAHSIARGEGKWPATKVGTWDEEVRRFHGVLKDFDGFLASTAEIKGEIPRLIQGPLADAINHIGQLMMLRRMTGAPVYGENYYVADISIGRVGPDQAPPVKPF